MTTEQNPDPDLLTLIEGRFPALSAHAAQLVKDQPDEARTALRSALAGDLGPIRALVPAAVLDSLGAQERPLPAPEPDAGPPPAPIAPRLTAPQTPTAPVEEWNPLATLEETSHPVPASGGRATVLLRPWSGRERLAYEDQLLISFLVDDDKGSATVRLGQMRLIATSLTLRGSTGFPPREDGSAMFSGENKPRVQLELLALDPAVYDEIKILALGVQPLPSANIDGPDDDGDGDGEEGPDPFPTPSTPATAAQVPEFE